MSKWLNNLREKLADEQYKGSFVDYVLPSSEESDRKIAICKSCEFYKIKSQTCQICGCFLPIKTKIAFFKCPKNKWL